MGIEIERKFLVRSDAWKAGVEGTVYRQGYLCSAVDRTVRVRVAGARAYLTVKGRSQGASRAEYEYAIPVDDAEAMLRDLCERPLIEKTRYRVPHRGHVWEVDVFAGDNAGLVVAEVELKSEGEAVELPEWVGAEVTGDPRYQNSNLVSRPYTKW